MAPDEEIDPCMAIDDDEVIAVLAPFYDLRPPRHAWRSDISAAPNSKPIYAREPNSLRVLIAIRDDEGWATIRRDGELRHLEAIASWAPLHAALS